MTIQDIRLNQVELKLADTDDPVAQKTQWSPAKRGGANFRQQKLVEQGRDVLLIVPTLGHTAFCLFFIVLGSIVPGILGYHALREGETMPLILVSVIAVVFVGAGILMLRSNQPIRLDRRSGWYQRGKQDAAAGGADRQTRGRLADIHALQIVAEVLQSKNGSYRSFEINAVFADGERVNLMDHGDCKAIDASALRLASFLNVPVWRAVC